MLLSERVQRVLLDGRQVLEAVALEVVDVGAVPLGPLDDGSVEDSLGPMLRF
jgi:hypothetical protein